MVKTRRLTFMFESGNQRRDETFNPQNIHSAYTTLMASPKNAGWLPKPKLTQKFINTKVRRPERGQTIYRDTVLRGFGLRVTHGSMSYVVEARIQGVSRRLTVGPHGPLTPELARQEAQRLLASMTTGTNPKDEEERLAVLNVTLADVLQNYLATRPLRPNSVRSFKQIVNRCLAAWLAKPIRSITKEMVICKHKELTILTRQNSSGKAQANLAMERLSVLINFAANAYEVDGEPIVEKNPVKALSQLRAWHRVPRRQSVIPDHKLSVWYKAVMEVSRSVVRDYLLLLLFTGLRRNEAATLRWSDIDFEGRVLTIRPDIAKNYREHNLPLTDFLVALLLQRKCESASSEYVFPGRGGRSCMVDSGHIIEQVGKQCEFKFMIHDLRRNFLTAAEKLEVPHYVLKKLANHTSSNDVTAGYIVVDVERLRAYMERISDHFLKLLGASKNDLA